MDKDGQGFQYLKTIFSNQCDKIERKNLCTYTNTSAYEGRKFQYPIKRNGKKKIGRFC